MGGGIKKSRGAISDINVTPFVDIVLVLLVVLMVTAVQVVKGSIPVDLPSASAGTEAVPSTVNVVIDGDGKLFLDGVLGSESALAKLVKREARKDPKVQAVIAADKSIAYEKVIRVIDVIKSNGAKSFALNISRAR
jgi:biopolymer transport protein TolR